MARCQTRMEGEGVYLFEQAEHLPKLHQVHDKSSTLLLLHVWTLLLPQMLLAVWQERRGEEVRGGDEYWIGAQVRLLCQSEVTELLCPVEGRLSTEVG